MKCLSFLLILVSSLFFCQSNSYKITYKIDYVKDSTEQKNRYEELAYLFFNAEKSYFLSVNKYKSDSILSSFKNNQNPTLGSLMNKPKFSSNFKFTLEKDKDEFIFREKIAGLGNFIYTEKNEFKNLWKLISGTENILGYQCKKAIIHYGGRVWYAWFSEEIPISEGPYKFNGLPGLILKIQDAKNQYSIEAIGIEKVDFTSDVIYQYSTQEVQTDRDRFIQLKRNYYQNPVKASNGRLNYLDKRKEGDFIKRMRKNNNPIELY